MKLPMEIIIKILDFIDILDLLNIKTINKTFYKMIILLIEKKFKKMLLYKDLNENMDIFRIYTNNYDFKIIYKLKENIKKYIHYNKYKQIMICAFFNKNQIRSSKSNDIDKLIDVILKIINIYDFSKNNILYYEIFFIK